MEPPVGGLRVFFQAGRAHGKGLHAGVFPFEGEGFGQRPTGPAIHAADKRIVKATVFGVCQLGGTIFAQGKIGGKLQVQAVAGGGGDDLEGVIIALRQPCQGVVHHPGNSRGLFHQAAVKGLNILFFPAGVDDYPFLVVGNTSFYAVTKGFPVYEGPEAHPLYTALYDYFTGGRQGFSFLGAAPCPVPGACGRPAERPQPQPRKGPRTWGRYPRWTR